MADIMKVGGVAIRAGKSRNDINYTATELAAFAKTIKGRPILKDHKLETDNTIGKLTEGSSIDEGKTVNYEGWLKEDGSGLFEKIQDGRISEVSIGAHVERIVESDKGELFAEGLTCMEISTTPTPGIKGTSLTQALKSEGKIPTISESFDIIKETKEVDKMADDEPVKEEPVVEEPVTKEPVKEEPVTEEPVEVKKEESIKLNIDTSSIDEALQKVEQLTKAKEALKEKVNKVKDIKENTKGKVVKEEVKEETPKSNIIVEQCSYGEGVSLWKEPAKDGKLI